MNTVTRTEPSSQQATARPLTAADRCDSCQARAYLRAVLPSGGELLFCAHHANAHRPGLLMAGALFQDETSQLSGS